MNDRSVENRLRRRLKKEGYALQKSRGRGKMDIDDLGGYRIIDANGWIVAGERFDLDLEDVLRFAEK